MDRLALELEPVDLEDLVPGVKLAGPLGRAALDHAANDHALALVAHGGALRKDREMWNFVKEANLG